MTADHRPIRHLRQGRPLTADTAQNGERSPAPPLPRSPAGLKWTRYDWAILVLLALLVLLFHWRLITPDLADRQSYPPGDFSAQFWAFSTFEARELSAGRAPLWNPYTYAGSPFWADAQSAVLYPFSLLTLLLSGLSAGGFSLFALELEAIFHFWLAGSFMYLFVRRVTQSRSAGFIAALIFTFGGYLTGYPSQQLAVLEVDVWLPLILFFIDRALFSRGAGEQVSRGAGEQVSRYAGEQVSRYAGVQDSIFSPAHLPTCTPAHLRSRPRIRDIILAGLAWGAALLAGHPQSWMLVGYTFVAYFLFLAVFAKRRILPPVADQRKVRGGRIRTFPAGGRTEASPPVADQRKVRGGRIKTFPAGGRTEASPPVADQRKVRGGRIKTSPAGGRTEASPPVGGIEGGRNRLNSPSLSRWKYLPSLALIILIGFGLAAIQLLPAIEYTRFSVRAEGLYDKMAGGLPLVDAIQVLLPGVVSHYSPLYVGAIGLLLAIAALFYTRNPFTTFWGVWGGLALLISFGGNTFLYSPLYLTTPGFSIFRGQERWAFVAAFSLAVLAGYGMKQLSGGAGEQRRGGAGERGSRNLPSPPPPLSPSPLLKSTGWLLLGAIGLIIVFFYGLNDTGWSAESQFYQLLNRSVFLAILLALTFIALRVANKISKQWLSIAFSALIIFDLFSINWQTNLYPQPPEWHTQKPALVAAIEADALEGDDLFRVYNEFRLYDNYGVPFEMQDLWGASPLRLSRYDEFLSPPMLIERAWAMLNVKYVITWRSELYAPSTIIYQEPASDGITYVHRLEDVGPRAWLVHQVEQVSDAEMVARLAEPGFDFLQTALVEDSRWAGGQVGRWAGETGETGETGGKDRVELTSFLPGRVALEVETGADGLLVLSEVVYPGWRAIVDGVPTPIVRANYILRAAPVSAGRHRVIFEFVPLTFRGGVLISWLTLLGSLFVLLRRRM